MNIEVMTQPTPFDFHIVKIFVQALLDPYTHSVEAPVTEGDPFPVAVAPPFVRAGSTLLTEGTDYTWPVDGTFHLITSQTEPITASYIQMREDDGYPASIDLKLDISTHDIANASFDEYNPDNNYNLKNVDTVASVTTNVPVRTFGLMQGQGVPGYIRENVFYGQDVKQGQTVTVQPSLPTMWSDYPLMSVTEMSYVILGYRI